MSDGILNPKKTFKQAITRVNPAETKEYLVLGSLGDETFFKICIGRSEAYEFIKSNIEFIDPYESFVLVQGRTLEDRITVYTFVEEVMKKIVTDDFDINDYVTGDFIPEDEKEEVEVPSYMKDIQPVSNFLESQDGGEEI